MFGRGSYDAARFAHEVREELSELFKDVQKLLEEDVSDFSQNELRIHRASLCSAVSALRSAISQELIERRSESAKDKKELTKLGRDRDAEVQANEDLRQRFADYQARVDEILAKAEQRIKELEAPPLSYGYFIRKTEDGQFDIMSEGRRVVVGGKEELEPRFGQRLLLAQGTLSVIKVLPELEERGSQATVDEVLPDGRIRVVLPQGDKAVYFMSYELEMEEPKPGDLILIDGRSGFVLSLLPKPEVTDIMLEGIPDITYAQVGGNASAIAKLRENLETPMLLPEEYRAYELQRAKGILLYGPPGVGKTLALKAVANMVRQTYGKQIYLLNIKGPELLNMYVGQTEAGIRQIFTFAREKGKEDAIVFVLFDEIDSMFPPRNSRQGDAGVSHTSFAQFATELDGVEEHSNIVIIGTTNRQDLIDPALTRPGRLEVKIEFERPDEEGTREIFRIYLKPTLPIHAKYVDPEHLEWDERYAGFGEDREDVVQYFIDRAMERIFGETEKQRIVTIQYDDTGERESFYMKHFISGALIKSIVDRAKKNAIEDFKSHGEQARGLRLKHLLDGLEEAFDEVKSLPDRTNPLEWARMLNLPAGHRRFTILSMDEDSEMPSSRDGRRMA